MSTSSTSLYIYLVDDDPDHVLMISRAISKTGQQTEVHTVDNGETALALLRTLEVTPDLILLDINMPGLSGLEVLAQIKADARLKRIPVVMLTSSELSTDVARAYELGASGYITKPSHPHDLRAVLGNTLLYWSIMKRATAEERAIQ